MAVACNHNNLWEVGREPQDVEEPERRVDEVEVVKVRQSALSQATAIAFQPVACGEFKWSSKYAPSGEGDFSLQG